jgi:REP-associated tyrosine transposase
MKRTTIPGLPHHVIQRGLHSRKTFLSNQDYRVYLEIMSDCIRRHGVEIWAYCLMPDHVHLIAIPQEKNSLSNCLRAAHGRYTKYINQRTGNSGQFWQGRYASHLLDEQYLIACTRYIEINPVKRDYVAQPDDWKWSSAMAHTLQNDDSLVQVKPLLQRVKRKWQDFLAEARPENEADLFYLHEKNGQPLGNDAFKVMVEQRQQDEN